VKYLLDTDHLSVLQRQSRPEYEILASQIAQHASTDLAFSIVSFHEQVMGCHAYISRAHSSMDVVRGYQMLARVLRDFAVAPVVPFDEAAAAVFDGLTTQRIRVGTMDLRIASIALSRRMILVTRNRSDFRKVLGLQVEDWTSLNR
jgi:tRNA(fMet)-specific endonuclease VapC